MRSIFVVLLVILFAGCTQYKKAVYLQNETASDSTKVAAIENYILQPGDLLHIRVYSPDPEINDMFNFETDQQKGSYNELNTYLNGFQLNDSCRIELPVVGYVELQGLTLVKARQVIADSVDTYVNNASIKVRLLSYRVTVLGHVGRPGVRNIYRDHSTIFDVLSMSGDIKPLGDRTSVEVIRKYEHGNRKISIDLTQLNAMKSQAYHIYPNDVIYVKPLRAKSLRDNIPILSLTLSTLTTFLLILNYFR